MKILKILICCCLFLPSLEAKPLQRGKDLLFLKPAKILRGKIGSKIGGKIGGKIDNQIDQLKYALVFKKVSASQFDSSVKLILNSKGLSRFIADYQWLAKKINRPARPIPYVFSSHQGVSFCNFQPYIILGGTKKKLRFGPVIYLSASTYRRLQAGRLPERTLCHEMGHALMGAFLSKKDIKKGLSPEYLIALLTGEGHWRSKKTDPVFAFSEGWAEYCGAYYKPPSHGYRYLKAPFSKLAITEGAIAELLLRIGREGKIGNFHRRLLVVVAKDHPSQIYELLFMYGQRYPRQKTKLKKAIDKITNNQWNSEKKYDLSHLLKDGRKNWVRLYKIGRSKVERARDLLSHAEKWKNMAREIWKAYPYLRKELERFWPEFKREAPRVLKRWLKRKWRKLFR